MDNFDFNFNFITNPNSWPNWPALPLKRMVGDRMETGYLWGDPKAPIKLYKGNIWDVSENDPIIAEFQSVEDIVAAGWVVD